MSRTERRVDSDAILERLAEHEEVDGTVATEAEVVETHDDSVTVSYRTRLVVRVRTGSETMPESTYDGKCGRYKSYTERFDYPPERYASRSIDFITKDEVAQTCGRCAGDTSIPCPDCGGEGSEQCPNCAGTTTVTCSDCEGSGTQSCGNCSGSGSVSESERSRCVRCEGSATVECSSCHGNDSDCATCGGDGTEPCPDCDGNGVVTESVSLTCPSCEGNQTEACDGCDGTEVVDCGNCDATGTVTCDRCRGTTKVPCPSCEGDGKTVTATVGEVTYERETDLRCSSDRLSVDLFERGDTDGGRTETSEPAERPGCSESGVHRETVETAQVDCEHVVYSFHGEQYAVTSVDGEVRFLDYPRSSTYIQDQIESATAEGYFEYGHGGSMANRLGARIRALVATGLWTAIGVGAVVLFIAVSGVLAVAVLPGGGAMEDLVVLGGAAVAGIVFARRLYSDTPRSDSAVGVALLAAFAVTGVAAAVIALGLWSPADRVMAVAVAAAAVSTQTADQLRLEAKRVSHALDKREEFLIDRLDGRYDEVERHDLGDQLPDTEYGPLESTFRRAARGVYVAGFGLSVFYIGLLAVSGVTGSESLLLQYIGFTLALVVPATIIVASLGVWLALFPRRI